MADKIIQNERERTHLVILPSLGMKHVIPLLEFSRRLAANNEFSITFIIIKPHLSSRQIAYAESILSAGLDIRFIEFPQVDFKADEDCQPETVGSKLIDKSRGYFEDVIKCLRKSPSPIRAIITDVFCSTLLDVSGNLWIPTYVLFTWSASVLGLMLYLPKHVSELRVSFKYADSPVEVPGLPPIPAGDLPAALQYANDDEFDWFVHHCSQLAEVDGIFINTFHDLESQAIKSIVDGKFLFRDGMPDIYTVGPLISSPLSGSGKLSIENKEECLKWLDRQPASSVLFVSFGNMGTLYHNQTEELALGLEASGQRFLWVLSTLSSDRNISNFLPEGFETRTKDRGLVVLSWAPQISVLSHPSTGGFLSHCSWNSTLESISFGVPIIAWPQFAEQRMTKFLLVNEIKVALELKPGEDGIVRKDEVERVVRELREGEEGTKVRTRAQELKESAERALAEGGTTYKSLAGVIKIWTKGFGN